jgi:hypothetical protein
MTFRSFTDGCRHSESSSYFLYGNKMCTNNHGSSSFLFDAFVAKQLAHASGQHAISSPRAPRAVRGEPPNGLALSCAALIDRYDVRAHLTVKIATILGPRSGVSYSAVLGAQARER